MANASAQEQQRPRLAPLLLAVILLMLLGRPDPSTAEGAAVRLLVPASSSEPVAFAWHVRRAGGLSVCRADLDAVEAVDDKTKLLAALSRKGLKAAGFDKATLPGPSHERASSPEVWARLFWTQYGPDSLLTRGATAVAALSKAAERSSELPFDGVTAMTKRLTGPHSRVWRLGPLRQLHVRSRVNHRRPGVVVSARW